MPISAVPYYGGKWRMCSYIASMLDYEVTNYAEVFGGGCRVLLNKRPHRNELYLESSPLMCALISVLSDREKALEFIRELQGINYCEEDFYNYRAIKEEFESELVQNIYNNFIYFLKNIDSKYNSKLQREFEDIFIHIMSQNKYIGINFGDSISILSNEDEVILQEHLRKMNLCITKYFDNFDIQYSEHTPVSVKRAEMLLKKAKNKPIDSKQYTTNELSRWTDRYCIKKELSKESLKKDSKYKTAFNEAKRRLIIGECISNFVDGVEAYDEKEITEMELAITAFVIQHMSFGAIGRTFRRGGKEAAFRRAILNLDKVINRLQGVQVIEGNAFRQLEVWKMNNISDLMVVCDPPYVGHYTGTDSPKEIKLNEMLPRDVYSTIWTRRTHENFLKIVVDAPYRVLVTNYTDKHGLYDSYLSSENGWSRREYLTKVTVSDKKDNFRTECIWTNY